jgi:hypothetical protein
MQGIWRVIEFEFPYRAKIGAPKGGGMTFPKQVTLSTAWLTGLLILSAQTSATAILS